MQCLDNEDLAISRIVYNMGIVSAIGWANRDHASVIYYRHKCWRVVQEILEGTHSLDYGI